MNLPNKISIARICLLPFVVFFYLETLFPYGKLIAGLIFIIATMTDFVDGYIARKYNMVTTLGKFLDTIADKVMVMTAILLLLAVPLSTGKSVIAYPSNACLIVSVVCFIIILAREFLISAFRQIAATKNVVMAADKLGKIKAFLQDIMLVLYFAIAFIVDMFPTLMEETVGVALSSLALSLLILSTILTIASAINYVIKNKQVLSDEN